MTGTTAKQLRQALDSFDGNAVSMLSEIDAQFSGSEHYGSAVIALIGDEAPLIQRGASWLLHHGRLTPQDVASRRLAEQLGVVTDWQAALHLLQFAATADTDLPPQSWAPFAKSYLDHKRPFLRAWSMAALCRLAETATSLRPDAKRAHQAALEDKAASVRARARKTDITALD